jgi:hypothetical protein
LASLADVFQTLNEMKADGVITDYAIGGALAALFYAEVTSTYDIDVFALIPSQSGPIIDLSPLYHWARKRGFEAEGEHLIIHSVPVQFLAADEGLEGEAVERSRDFDYEAVPVRVIGPEHLAILYTLAGGARRRGRVGLLFEAGTVDEQELDAILRRHGLTDEWKKKRGTDVGS